MAACNGEACVEGCFGVKIQHGLIRKVCLSVIFDVIYELISVLFWGFGRSSPPRVREG